MSKYNESSIKILEGLDAVKKRPAMYIGSTDKKGLHHLVWEIVDNAVDEVINGFGSVINVILHTDNSISIEDFGRGIPVGMHESGKPTPEVIYTILHAGGKFESSGYKISGGLHGVGASVVNALSEFMEVTICKDKKEYFIRFIDGGHVDVPLKKLGSTNKSGTKVLFKPSSGTFGKAKFSFSNICERMRESAFLINNLTINVIDEEIEKKETFHFEDGLKEFVNYLNDDKTPIHPVLTFSGIKDGIEVNVALQYTESYQESIISFVNNVKTNDGGTHEVGFKTAITRAFNEYAKDKDYLKAKDKNFEGSDTREGLTAIVSLKIPESMLQFEGQTKSRLGTPSARSITEGITTDELKIFLEENNKLATDIVERMMKNKTVREAARNAREKARNGKDKKQNNLILSGRLTPAQKNNKKKNELFLVEGISAGGTAKNGRFREFQAILSLRGKVINSEKARLEDLMKNEEINTIIHAIGAGVGSDFDVDESNYDKVIIMTDADDDGAHIQILLLTFFYRYMKPLIESGKLYIAEPPLYKIENKSKSLYAYDDDEKDLILSKLEGKSTVARYKGLGEMMTEDLKDTTMDPENRRIIQITIDDSFLVEKRVSVLMGDKIEPRKEWIEENIDFNENVIIR